MIGSSLDIRLVGEPFPGSAGDEAFKPVKRVPLDVALIEPEGELANVSMLPV